VTPWDACGNRLLVVVGAATDEELRQAHHVAGRCFSGEERHADGVAWFAPRDDFVRTAFFNPDGSYERLCGNSLLIAAAVFGHETGVKVRPFDHPAIEVRASASRVEAGARVPIDQVLRGASAGGKVFDTGSPHLVIERADTTELDLAGLARPLVASLDVNVTVYALSGEVATVRTFERGVNAETLACGTGALAVALSAERALEVRYRGGSYSARAERGAGHVEWSLSTTTLQLRRH
jgi:diaminopimelate epimerase